MTEKPVLEMVEEAEQFYKDAFCAESSTILPPSALEKFKIVGVVKIIRGGKPFISAHLSPRSNNMDYLCPECGPLSEDVDVYLAADTGKPSCVDCHEQNLTPLVDAYDQLQAQRDELRELLRGLSYIASCECTNGRLDREGAYATPDGMDLLYLCDLLDRADEVLSTINSAQITSSGEK